MLFRDGAAQMADQLHIVGFPAGIEVHDEVGVFGADRDAADPVILQAALVDQSARRFKFGNVAEGAARAAAGGFAFAPRLDFGAERGDFGFTVGGGQFQLRAGDHDVVGNGAAAVTPLDFVVAGAPRIAAEVEAADFDDEIADRDAVGTGVHPERAAEGAGDAGQPGQPAEAEFDGAAGQVGQPQVRTGADDAVFAAEFGKAVAVQPDAEHRAGGVHADEVGAAADHKDRNRVSGGEAEQSGQLLRVLRFGEHRQRGTDAERSDVAV